MCMPILTTRLHKTLAFYTLSINFIAIEQRVLFVEKALDSRDRYIDTHLTHVL